MRAVIRAVSAVVMLCLGAATAVAAEDTFPRYPGLEPAVGFWTRVFGEFSELQTAVHSSRHPGKVFEVLDFRADAQRMTPGQLDRYRDEVERQTRARYDALLREVHALRATPQKMNAEQKRIFDLYADLKADNRFSQAVGTLRGQRGLYERTGQALEIAGGYLPTMESTFASYQLPLMLTRLPMVESSFNVEAYSKVGAAGLWQFMPSSARIYMRMDDTVDDRSDPWTSTDAAARHLRDDYAVLKSWPLALTAYNHGRGGIARALKTVKGSTLMDLIERYDSPRWGFASRNFYAEFLAATDVERNRSHYFPQLSPHPPLAFETVRLEHYVPWSTLQKLSGADAEAFRRLNPAYREEVITGQLYVPSGHSIRVPAGTASAFQVGYASLGEAERHRSQRQYWGSHRVASGESLGRIAARHGTTVKALQQANNLGKSAMIRAGQTLKIPPRGVTTPKGPVLEPVPQPVTVLASAAVQHPTAAATAPRQARVHKVRNGQTLDGIARQYRVTVADLQRLNKLSRPELIRAGQTLKIPSAG